MQNSKYSSIKFAMMSGAFKNAGDFLIVKRCESLLTSIYPNSTFTYFNRGDSLNDYLESINSHDIMILCGGPAYLPNLYPDIFPLTTNLNDIKIPIFALGLGWFGASSSNFHLLNYKLSASTIHFLERIESDTKLLGCRDWYSVNMLRNNNIYTGIMTGCPAWYDLNYVNQLSFKQSNHTIKKICISDPAAVGSLNQLVNVAMYLKQVFSSAQIQVVFHRGTTADNFTSREVSDQIQQSIQSLTKLGIESIDISYGASGFTIYDDCDLHIGFRVHAHIYNLSQRNISILIEEDGRGSGVNQALGLSSITSFELISNINTNTSTQQNMKIHNNFLIQNIDDALNNLVQTNYHQMENAYSNMHFYHNTMIEHLKTISNFI